MIVFKSKRFSESERYAALWKVCVILFGLGVAVFLIAKLGGASVPGPLVALVLALNIILAVIPLVVAWYSVWLFSRLCIDD
ncbi:hypothetical protein ACFL13_00010 [Patescibacteria group bacterium]